MTVRAVKAPNLINNRHVAKPAKSEHDCDAELRDQTMKSPRLKRALVNLHSCDASPAGLLARLRASRAK